MYFLLENAELLKVYEILIFSGWIKLRRELIFFWIVFFSATGNELSTCCVALVILIDLLYKVSTTTN